MTRSRRDRLLVASMLLVTVAIVWWFRLRGWYPHDEGTLGQAAERMLRGEIPHRDFDDPYTGGLSLWHALIFRIAGVRLEALRSALAVVTIAWLGLVYRLVRRWLTAPGAALVVLLLGVWSVPLYPASMPSWYILFFGTAAGALLVSPERITWRIAAAAGLLVGLASIAKITAIFLLAGAGWAIVALRQRERERRAAPEIVAAALLFALMVFRLVHVLPGARFLVQVGMPAILVALAIAAREGRHGRAARWGFDVALWGRLAALTIAACLPFLLFLGWLASHGAAHAFLVDLTGVVGERAAFSSFPPPSIGSIVYSIPVLVVILGAERLKVRARFVLALALLILALTFFDALIYLDLWFALRGLLASGVWALAAAIIWWRPAPDVVSSRGVLVFGALSAAVGLSQFPFAAPIYFLYLFPLIVLALAAAVAAQPLPVRRVSAAVAVAFIAFGASQVLPGAPESLDAFGLRYGGTAWLASSVAHLRVPVDEAELFNHLDATLRRLPPGPIWAGPDAPEVAFLSRRADLNRAFFAFLGNDTIPSAHFGEDLAARGAVAVVINTTPEFSPTLPKVLEDSLLRYFPQMDSITPFVIYSRPGRR